MRVAISCLTLALLMGCATQSINVERTKITYEASGTSLFYSLDSMIAAGNAAIDAQCKRDQIAKFAADSAVKSLASLNDLAKTGKSLIDLLFPAIKVKIAMECKKSKHNGAQRND